MFTFPVLQRLPAERPRINRAGTVNDNPIQV